MTTRPSRNDAHAERALQASIRRRLLMRYLSDVFAEEEILDAAVEEAFTSGEAFRSWLSRQGINPDTLAASTPRGRALIQEFTNTCVREAQASHQAQAEE
jgi:hypothetical protein